MRIMAIGAHPDDIEICCSGTLAKFSQKDHEIIMAYVTDGGAGHKTIPPDEMREIRRNEAQAACAVIGADMLWFGLPDEFVFDDLETRLLFVDKIREARPEVIITHGAADYHHDHRAVHNMVLGASFIATLTNVRTKHPEIPSLPKLFYMDTLAGTNFIPEEYVDISEQFHIKKEMLSKHQSQLKWLKDHDNIDILEFIEVMARSRGLQCGVNYAEGFCRERVWGRMEAERILP